MTNREAIRRMRRESQCRSEDKRIDKIEEQFKAFDRLDDEVDERDWLTKKEWDDREEMWKASVKRHNELVAAGDANRRTGEQESGPGTARRTA